MTPGASQAPSALPGRAVQVEHDRVVGEPLGAARRTTALESRPPTARSMLRDPALDPDRLAVARSPAAPSGAARAGRRTRRRSRGGASPVTWPRGASIALPGTAQQRAQVEPARLPVLDVDVGLEQLGAADQVAEALHAERGDQAARLLGDAGAGTGRPARACRRSARAARDPASRRPTGQVFRWQTRIMMQPVAISGAVEIPTSSAPRRAATTTSRPVRIWPSVWRIDRVAKVAREQRLLGLGEADLPGHAGVLDRGLRRGAGAAVVAGDHDVVGARLGDAGGDRADAGLGGELDRDRRASGWRRAGRRSAA